jgi:hypothetical protein
MLSRFLSKSPFMGFFVLRDFNKSTGFIDVYGRACGSFFLCFRKAKRT